jgi:hypothetical protein
MDKELRELIDSLMYDIGQLPYKFMCDHPAARSAFYSYEKLAGKLAEIDNPQEPQA